MTHQTLKEAFGELYVDGEMKDYDLIVTGESKFIYAVDFIEIFGNCDLTYSCLSEHPIAKNSGWGNRFKEWYEQGILK